YPWIVDPFNNPWKIQCPECKRRFPSNDFASLYNLVVEEYGEYNVELAHKMNDEIVEKSGGSIDYLKNTAYPEVGSAGSLVKLTGKETVEGWGVDDGLGYDTGRVYSNGTKEIHTYLAYFVHFGYWYNYGTNSAQMIQAINTLADAYIYTGDEKYGRLGAILVDRIADLYPDYEIEPWKNLGYYNQGGARGKILYNIWECALAEDLAIAYDALFPAFDDPEVIEFVSEKANRYGYTDKLTDVSDGEGTVKKVTGETLRSNVENNFLREIFDAAQNSKIRGNFGFHQSTVAAAGVVLDTQPDTNAMLDWVFNNGSSGDTYNTGGNISESLIDLVSRDGQGNESAPSYNRIWLTELAALADILAEYDAYKSFGIWNNPKYFTMWRSYNPMTLVRRGVAPIGDCGLTGSFEAYPDSPEGLLEAYRHAKELHEDTAVEIAQLFYQLHTLTNKDVKGIHYNIFTENPESVEQEIEDIIETHGEYPDYDRSSMLTGYGFAALRAGTLHETVGADVIRDTTRDFWMYFGGAASHSHYDTLNIGVEAYGISLSPDNGYPEQTGHDPNRAQWTNPTLSHNAVVVNEVSQLKNQFPAKPLHYDGKDTRVKVMDVDASDTYIETDEYRRTVVMVDYDDEISYGIDFFKVRGGNDHLYSFHAASEEVFDCSEEIDFFEQPGGSYAGIDVPFGNDPQTNQSSSYVKLKYPIGYTWLFDVRRADNPGLSEFFVDYNIIDMQNYSRNNKKMDIHLRMTMVNDFEPDEITLAKGYPPRKPKNQQYLDYMQYMLVRRKGRDLNTLFTTVIEPYNKERYIKEIKPATVTASEDTGTDKASAVKVTLADGRIDYIVYAQNNDITYTVTDNETGYSFTFSGFIGVWTVKSDGNGGYVNVYSYINDGTTIGEGEFLVDGKSASIKGCVTDFTVEPAFDNYIDVEFNRTLSDEEAQSLVDCMINVESEEPGNAAYVIKDVLNFNGNSARLDIGAVTTVNSYKDRSNINGGYNYDIAAGKAFEIALSYEENGAPKLSDPGKQSVTAGSSIAVQLTATSDDGPIMFEPRTIPRGASIDSNTGKFTWKPDASQVGDNLVSIDAVDVLGRRTTQHFTVTVYGATTGSPSQSEDGTGSTDTTDTPSGGGGGGGGGAAPAPDTDENVGDDDESLPLEEKVPSEGEADEVENGDTANIRFTDLGDHAWASDAINELAKAGIIKGTSETTFSPAANITRADFALLLVRAFNLESDNTENFADVSETDYFAAELAIARNTGIVGGIGDNKYALRSTITRQDMMVIVYRALTKLGMEFAIEEVDYPDIEAVAPYAKDAVKALITAGLVNGKNGLVEPATYTTRAEVAVLVKRILDYVN
ncbi:MAG: S-layer homology domain-containing protein, partial [Oscillospiraceae bacterium]|nr:S-layer homology domain-containing protein [Oscillospiraceae bacterium]